MTRECEAAIERRQALILVGPTCSGKTEVALALARLIGIEVVSADSRQVYRYLDIGTAKPTPAERDVAPHHFIDILAPEEPYSAGMYGEQARVVVEDVFARGRIPVVVGGSGLYVEGLVDGFFPGAGVDSHIRNSLHRELETHGIESLVRQVQSADPELAKTVDRNNPRRILRALELYRMTGRPPSSLFGSGRKSAGFTPRFFGLRWNREALYERIHRRCDAMLEGGLLGEVEYLDRNGYGRGMNALNTVGYAEAFAFRAGEISEGEMVRLFKMNTRRYAKRQMTWFNADNRILWVSMKEGAVAENVGEEILSRFFGDLP